MAEQRDLPINSLTGEPYDPDAVPRRDRIPLDDALDDIEQQAEDLTLKAAMGLVTIAAWEQGMRGLIKLAHNVAAMDARGGAQMNAVQRFIEWAQRQLTLQREYGFLSHFAEEIRQGFLDEASALQSVINRARMYINAARQTWQRVRLDVAVMAGLSEKIRLLEPGARHCETCLEQAALGWVDIRDPRVTGLGETLCDGNDRCVIDYR